jgi:hypothetical protein
MTQLKGEAAVRAHLLESIWKLGLDFLDYENAFWVFCPTGKVLDFGDAGYHYLFNEYGKTRNEFFRKAIEDANPHFQPEFIPSSKRRAYTNLIEILKEPPPIDCTELQCEPCRFRRHHAATPESLFTLAQFCLRYEYSY